jgi:hypothetical protein
MLDGQLGRDARACRFEVGVVDRVVERACKDGRSAEQRSSTDGLFELHRERQVELSDHHEERGGSQTLWHHNSVVIPALVASVCFVSWKHLIQYVDRTTHLLIA